MSNVNTSVSAVEQMASLFCLGTWTATQMALEMMNETFSDPADRNFVRACNFYVGKNRPALEQLCVDTADTLNRKEILTAFQLLRG